MTNQLTWDKIPEKIRVIIKRYVGNDNSNSTKQMRLDAANEIMAAMKPELEKAWDIARRDWPLIDFETYYKQTYGTDR